MRSKDNLSLSFMTDIFIANHLLYKPNIAEVSSGFHQADWSTTFLLLSNQFFVLVYLFTCLSRNLILTISAQMQMSAQFKFALYIIND